MSVSISGTTGISTNGVQWMAGMILAFGNEEAPDGWLECNGDAVSRTEYARLFAAIGTKWGAGDGSTTFNLPDARAMYLAGTGTSPLEATEGEGDYYEGLDVGDTQRDQFQGHRRAIRFGDSISFRFIDGSGGGGTTGDVTLRRSDSPSSGDGLLSTYEYVNDGTNGVPRTGTTTHPQCIGILWCIKT